MRCDIYWKEFKDCKMYGYKLVLSYLSMTTDILVYGYMICCVNNCQVSDFNLLSLYQDKKKYFINTTVE